MKDKAQVRKITVIIPNYNGITYLPECLQALDNQEAGTPDFAVLVVDNGSTDGSVEWLKKVTEACSAITDGEPKETASEQKMPVTAIFLSENTGFDHAVNVGIEASETPYVILLNNDTKVMPGFVKNLYTAIERDARIFSVSACMLMWDRSELLDDAGDRYCALGWAFARGKGKPASAYDRPTEIFSACAGAAIYRKAVFDEIGLFDEAHFAYLEDLDIGYRARIYGWRNVYEPSAQVLHYGSAATGSRYNPRKTELAAQNSVYVIGKNMPFLQLLLNLPLLLMGFAVKFLFFCKKRMGGIYLKALGRGVRMCFSKEGMNRHVAFRRKNLKHYIRIQWELYVGILQFITNS